MLVYQFSPGELVKWNRNSSEPNDFDAVGMVISREGYSSLYVRWSDGFDGVYPVRDLRPFNPCDAAAA